MKCVLALCLLKLRDELRPADISHTQVLIIQTREANVHQYLAQAVVHCIQDEALSDRAVRWCRGAPCLQQLSGAAASQALDWRVSRSGRSGGSGREQLSGGAEQRPVFKGGAVEAEGGVVVTRGHCGTAWRANGAEVQNVLAPFAQRCHLPGLGEDMTGRLAGCGGGQVAATFYGGLEGEVAVGAVLLLLVLVQLRVSHVLESRNIGGYARVKESVFGAEEDGLLVQRVNQALFAARAAGLSLRSGFRSLAFNWDAFLLLLYLHLQVFVLLRVHDHSWGVTLCHLSDIQPSTLARPNQYFYDF